MSFFAFINKKCWKIKTLKSTVFIGIIKNAKQKTFLHLCSGVVPMGPGGRPLQIFWKDEIYFGVKSNLHRFCSRMIYPPSASRWNNFLLIIGWGRKLLIHKQISFPHRDSNTIAPAVRSTIKVKYVTTRPSSPPSLMFHFLKSCWRSLLPEARFLAWNSPIPFGGRAQPQ